MQEPTLINIPKISYTGYGSKSTLRVEEPILRKIQKIVSTGRGSEPTLREEELTLRNNRTLDAKIL